MIALCCVFTGSDSRSPGLLQALLLNNEAGADEEAGGQSKNQTLDIIRGHASIGVSPTGTTLSRHGRERRTNPRSVSVWGSTLIIINIKPPRRATWPRGDSVGTELGRPESGNSVRRKEKTDLDCEETEKKIIKIEYYLSAL